MLRPEVGSLQLNVIENKSDTEPALGPFVTGGLGFHRIPVTVSHCVLSHCLHTPASASIGRGTGDMHTAQWHASWGCHLSLQNKAQLRKGGLMLPT